MATVKNIVTACHSYISFFPHKEPAREYSMCSCDMNPDRAIHNIFEDEFESKPLDVKCMFL